MGPSAFIPGPVGRIESLVKLPEDESEPRFAAVVCHPHPLFGGSMHTRVIYRTATALARAGGAALRFNFRGVGLSSGSHDDGRGETDDLDAVLTWLRTAFPDLPLLLAGFSFGAWVGLRLGAADGRIEALIGIGLATTRHRYDELNGCTKPKLFIQGGADELGPADEVRALVDGLPPPKRLVVVAGADHLFTRGTDELERQVLEFAASRLATATAAASGRRCRSSG